MVQALAIIGDKEEPTLMIKRFAFWMTEFMEA
jgi:hypothetical protein